MLATVSQRKASKVATLAAKFEAIQAQLKAFAQESGGSFVVFGSVARGDIRQGSDLDVVVDFPPASRQAALEFAEGACVSHDVAHDIYLITEISPALAQRVARDGVVLR